MNDDIKINLDGSFTPGSSIGGCGVVARDAERQIIVACASRQDHIQDAFGAEVNVMATTADIDAIRVVFETDSQLLVDALDI